METEKIWSPSKDIEKIFSIEANGATVKERIFIDFHINGINQGGIIQMSKNMTRKIAFTVAASSDINVVEIVRNGKFIFYYLRVRTSIDGLAWPSPVFVLLQ